MWSLQGLYLDGNRLSGAIPAALGDLPRLSELYLENSGLSGCIPAGLSGVNSHDLDTLGLSDCATEVTQTLTLTSVTGGQTVPFAGTYTYRQGALVRVQAGPSAGNRVASWGGDCATTPASQTECILTMDADKTASVTFEQGTAYTLTTWGGAYGTTEPAPGAYRYHANASVTVTAVPEASYQVASWHGGCSGSGTTCTLAMDGDKEASVTFEEVSTYTLTTSAGANGSIDPAAGTHTYDAGTGVTVTATPDAGYRVGAWGGDCGTASGTTCELTMDGNRTASVTFERTYTLTTSSGANGSIDPAAGTHAYGEGESVTVTAVPDAGYRVASWGDDCSTASGTTCELTMDGNKTASVTFEAVCATPTDADCIRVVYVGAPGDYARLSDIPADVILTPNSNGSYYVERGQQVTVVTAVTAAALPTGWTRFYLQRSPLTTDPSPLSLQQLIQPAGTTYTFTPTTDPDGATLITFDLTAARPFVRPRPDAKPEIGDTLVTSRFQVTSFAYDTYDTTGEVAAAGSYAFLADADDPSTAVTTYEELRDGTTTALLIHKSDADGVSRADLYDAVETGDLFEWREAHDCFVRYLVHEVKPDPAGHCPTQAAGGEAVYLHVRGVYWGPPHTGRPHHHLLVGTVTSAVVTRDDLPGAAWGVSPCP